MLKIKVVNALGLPTKFIVFEGFLSLEIRHFRDNWVEIVINTGEPESSGSFFTQETPETVLKKLEIGEVITARTYKDLIQEYREKAIRDAKRNNQN